MFQLPNELIKCIFDYDNTYHSIYQLINHKIKYITVINELHNSINNEIYTNEVYDYKSLLETKRYERIENLFDMEELREFFFSNMKIHKLEKF
jgi:uncharacterized LabA/DUF88 family protein